MPVVCYKYNKPIRGAMFGFDKLVSDLDIETCAPDSWACRDSKYVYRAAGHVVAGSLKINADSRVRSVVAGVLSVGFLCRWISTGVAGDCRISWWVLWSMVWVGACWVWCFEGMEIKYLQSCRSTCFLLFSKYLHVTTQT